MGIDRNEIIFSESNSFHWSSVDIITPRKMNNRQLCWVYCRIDYHSCKKSKLFFEDTWEKLLFMNRIERVKSIKAEKNFHIFYSTVLTLAIITLFTKIGFVSCVNSKHILWECWIPDREGWKMKNHLVIAYKIIKKFQI